jgi:hypothetical protein
MDDFMGLDILLFYHTIETNNKKGRDDKVSPGDEFVKGGEKKKYKIEKRDSVLRYRPGIKFGRTIFGLKLF